jgi:hypothetical protein
LPPTRISKSFKEQFPRMDRRLLVSNVGRRIQRRKLMKIARVLIAAAVLVCTVPSFAQVVECTAPSCDVVMVKLDNPRDLAWGPDGGLYVAEAGRGSFGEPPSAEPHCFVANLQAYCYGPTGAISRKLAPLVRSAPADLKDQERVITGLPSMAAPTTGGRAEGPNGLSFHGGGALPSAAMNAGGYIAIGLETDPRRVRGATNELGEVGSYFGRLIKFKPNGAWSFVADIGQWEIDNNPVGGATRVDSNPFRVLAEPAGRLVVDAGGNSLLRVTGNDHIELIATFPSNPERVRIATVPGLPQTTFMVDSVPTSVVAGPDGAYYVSELTGFPFLMREANVYRVVPGETVPGTTPEIFLSGFKTIIDIAFAENGDLYVLEHSKSTQTGIGSAGSLVRVKLAGCTTDPDFCQRVVVRSGLPRATSVLPGPDGEAYVTVRGLDAGIGAVWRINP